MSKQQYFDACKALALAAGASVTANVRLDDAWFVVEMMNGVAQLVAASGSAIAGTVLGASPPLTTATANPPNACQVLVGIKLEQQQLTNDDVPLASYAVTPDKDGYLRTPIVIPPRATFSAKFTNNASVALDIRLVLGGYKTDEAGARRAMEGNG
jgi:hypothetical protein